LLIIVFAVRAKIKQANEDEADVVPPPSTPVA
jgi:hypothetical protein